MFFRTQLSAVFTVIKLVDVLDSQDEANLALLARPELGITFTKLHCWRLTQYDKCVFLDADTLVSICLQAVKFCVHLRLLLYWKALLIVNVSLTVTDFLDVTNSVSTLNCFPLWARK